MRRAFNLPATARRCYTSSSKSVLAQPISMPKLDSSTVLPPSPSLPSSGDHHHHQQQQQHPSRIQVPATTSNASASTEEPTSIRLTLRKKALDIESESLGFTTPSTFPYIWLRDVCQNTTTSIDGSTKQKLFKTEDIDPDIKPSNVVIDDKKFELVIEWDRPLRGKKEKETSRFPLGFLRAHADNQAFRGWYAVDDMESYRSWKQSDIARNLLTIPYEKLEEQPEILTQAASGALFRDGLVLFKNVPTENKTPDNCSLVTLAEKLGRTIRTWYGDKTFSVRSYANAKNIAYTSLPLDLHMDLLHFEDPPRYQFLHCLHLHPSLQGGTSYFVDSYKAAELLRQKDPQAFETLRRENVTFEYKNDGHWTFSEKPTFEFTKDDPEKLYAVNYSPPFQGPLRLYPSSKGDDDAATRQDPTERITSLHSALRKYSEILYDPSLRFEIQMKEGDCVAFDNRRVLHARTGFSVKNDEQVEGELRWLMGCYVDDTSVREKYRYLKSRNQEW